MIKAYIRSILNCQEIKFIFVKLQTDWLNCRECTSNTRNTEKSKRSAVHSLLQYCHNLINLPGDTNPTELKIEGFKNLKYFTNSEKIEIRIALLKLVYVLLTQELQTNPNLNHFLNNSTSRHNKNNKTIFLGKITYCFEQIINKMANSLKKMMIGQVNTMTESAETRAEHSEKYLKECKLIFKYGEIYFDCLDQVLNSESDASSDGQPCLTYNLRQNIAKILGISMSEYSKNLTAPPVISVDANQKRKIDQISQDSSSANDSKNLNRVNLQSSDSIPNEMMESLRSTRMNIDSQISRNLNLQKQQYKVTEDSDMFEIEISNPNQAPNLITPVLSKPQPAVIPINPSLLPKSQTKTGRKRSKEFLLNKKTFSEVSGNSVNSAESTESLRTKSKFTSLLDDHFLDMGLTGNDEKRKQEQYLKSKRLAGSSTANTSINLYVDQPEKLVSEVKVWESF